MSKKSSSIDTTDCLFPVVRTSTGFVRGRKRVSLYGDKYYAFEGIPFAKPPLGELRFRAPQPVDPWVDVLDCLSPADKPIQLNTFTNEIEGSENCLYLNIYVKTICEAKVRLPCMVLIFGGSFTTGEASSKLHGPDYFMKEDVLLMVMNYRLGPLGFLSLKERELNVPGNAGLKDQLLALQWFKVNCIYFNGDTDNITLFGHSAGSLSVNLHTIAKPSRELFHKAILMSGSIFHTWAKIPRRNYALHLAELLGYMGEKTDEQVLAYLMKKQGRDLVGHDVRTEEDRLNGIPFTFGPMKEPYHGDDTFMAEDFEEANLEAWGNHIPIMTGGVSFEALYMLDHYTEEYFDVIKGHPELFVPITVRRAMSRKQSSELGERILLEHMDVYDLSADGEMEYCKFISLKHFWVGLHRFLKARLLYSDAPTFLYRFDFDSPTFNFFRIAYCGPDIRGVCHGDEMAYLFRQFRSFELKEDSAEFQTIRRMVNIWTTFARVSDPNCEETKSVEWPRMDKPNPYICLNISDELEIMELPEATKFSFWDTIYGNEIQKNF